MYLVQVRVSFSCLLFSVSYPVLHSLVLLLVLHSEQMLILQSEKINVRSRRFKNDLLEPFLLVFYK